LQVLYQLDVDPAMAPASALELYWEKLRSGAGLSVDDSEPPQLAVQPGERLAAGAVDGQWERADGDGWCSTVDELSEVQRYCVELVLGVHRHQGELDELIQRVSRNWRIERMARVDRNVLRLSAFELAHRLDVPARAALNEAIEIARRYGTSESAAFVNGILDKVCQQLGR
jgi:N utilization substance protein B